MTLIRMRKVFLLARMLDAAVFLVPPRRSLNAAVTGLESDDIAIIPARSWEAAWLKLVWFVSAPWRAHDPVLWTARTAALFVSATVYGWLERATWVPETLRRALIAPRGVYQRLKAINTRYAAKLDEAWQELYRSNVLLPFRALEDRGDPIPVVHLRLPPDADHALTEEARRLGIAADAPLVTVHVRESGYRLASGLSQRGWDEIRNARIDSFFPAFAALIKRGYTVVRLGDRTMTPVSMPGVVDLATVPRRSAGLDAWCVRHSQFLVGCDSGPSWLAVLLDVPVLTVNAVHFRDVSRSMDRVICKLARDCETGAILSVSEMLTGEFLQRGFKGDRYEAIDNDPADITKAVIDMIDVVAGRERLSWPQKRFNRRLLEVDRRKLGGRSALEGVAVASRARGTLSRRFAQDHYEPASTTAERARR
jgi:putative glycosyltransferase (TIGR04372 family)